MALNKDKGQAADNCIFGHPKGCAHHKPPMVGGKPFHARDHADALKQAGLTVQKKELMEDSRTGTPPPGQPIKRGNTPIYPKRHFA